MKNVVPSTLVMASRVLSDLNEGMALRSSPKSRGVCAVKRIREKVHLGIRLC